MSETIEIRRRRALYRACHRGTKEMDWLLGRFAQARLAAMAAAELALFERLLAMADPDLQAWLLEPTSPGAGELAPLLGDLRAFHGLSGGPDGGPTGGSA